MTGEDKDQRIAQLEQENSALVAENHAMRESLRVIAYWAAAGLSSTIPKVS